MSFLALLLLIAAISPQGLPDDAQAKLRQGIHALQAGEYATAEQSFREVLKIDPRSYSAYCNLGVIYAKTERLDAAIQAFEQARELAPDVPGINLNLGLAYYRKEQFGMAIGQFERALQLDPAQLDAVYLLGLSDFRLDRYATTVQVLEPILDREKKNLFVLYALAVSYGKLHRPQDSIRTFNLFRDSGGDTPLFHLLLGKLYLDLGEYPDARRELERAVAADTTIPYSHLILGVA